tara:strand:+ start:574 stop:1293 length:720 start_codon:yes stop_codon:yes gene_type:complete
MNKKVMYFLVKLAKLIMVVKFFFKLFLFLFICKYSFSEIVYDKNNTIITEFDIETYQNLYSENYNTDISDTNALKDLILINNLVKDLEKNNKEFLNKIDEEILIRLNQNSIKNENLRNFLRFSRIRDEFLINYFQNKLTMTELGNLFKELDSLTLPISIDNCLIIKDIIDLKNNNEFVTVFYNNLKNNTRDFQITINNVKYKVCINELNFRTIENYIVDYIQIQTSDDFEKFVYEKIKN